MIEFDEVTKTYVSERGGYETTTEAVRNVRLTIPSLQFVSLVGASGCGKTTLLRLIAGLLLPTRGRVLVDGHEVTGPGPDRAVVFQHSGLYPWRTVAANVRLGLDLSHDDNGSNAEKIVDHYLELVGLTEFADHYPHQLSGGMQQRVGLARALAVSPSNLLLDEPFGSVDALTREELGGELLRIWEDERRTVVFVTHSLEEALTLADRVVVMRAGEIVADVEVDLSRPRDPSTLRADYDFALQRRALAEVLQ